MEAKSWDSFLEAYQKVLDDRDRALMLLARLEEWDIMQTTDDGPYWIGEIQKLTKGKKWHEYQQQLV